MDEVTYASLPEELQLRAVRVRVRVPQRGFRTQVLVVVTTLLDAETYTATDLAEVYRRRWQAEKVTLGMDVLRCQSPAMVRKEVWAHLLAYNLIRAVMAQTAQEYGADPRDTSFAGALQALTAFAERLLEAEEDRREQL
jgi:hypothetical protein